MKVDTLPAEPAEQDRGRRLRAAAVLAGAVVGSAFLALLLFFAVLRAEWLTPALARLLELLFAQPAWAIAAATSPLWAGLLVGYGYMRRAMRRRQANGEAF